MRSIEGTAYQAMKRLNYESRPRLLAGTRRVRAGGENVYGVMSNHIKEYLGNVTLGLR